MFLQLKLSTAAKDVSWLGSGRDKDQCINAIVQRIFTPDMEIGALNERVHHHVTGLRRELAKTAREAQYGTLKEFVMGFPTARTDQDQGDANAHIQLSHKPFPERINNSHNHASVIRHLPKHSVTADAITVQRIQRLRALNRLTADIGIHARGWSPAYASKYLRSKADLLAGGLVKLLSAS